MAAMTIEGRQNAYKMEELPFIGALNRRNTFLWAASEVVGGPMVLSGPICSDNSLSWEA